MSDAAHTVRAAAGAFRRSVSRCAAPLASPKVVSAITRLLPHGRGVEPSGASASDAGRILVVRPDGIGDLVLMTPFLRELRRSNPSAWITLVVNSRFINLVELCPHVNEVLGIDIRWHGKTVVLGLALKALRFSRAHLWPRRFDLALAPRWGADFYHSAYVAHFSKAPCRIGYSEDVLPYKTRVNSGFDRLFTRVVHDRWAKHELVRNLEFLRACGGSVGGDTLELWLSAEDKQHAREVLNSHGIRPGGWIVCVAPGAGHAKRMWPARRFAELARHLIAKYGAQFVLIGSGEDRERASRIQEALGSRAVNLAGGLTLRQTAALAGLTQLIVANDSGPMHIAAAAGTPVLEISCHPATGDPNHDNSPVRFHPWARDYAVVQPPEPFEPCTTGCDQLQSHCILSVSVEQAAAAADELLARCEARTGCEDPAGKRYAAAEPPIL